jgi:hypothetical protein
LDRSNLQKVESTWVVDRDLFRQSDHFGNSEFEEPEVQAKTLAGQVPETRKEVSCVKSKSDEFGNSELRNSGFRKS